MSRSEADLLKDLSWRYATKKFDSSRRIPDATWQTLRQAVSLTPTSFGLEPYRLVEVRDPKIRQSLREVAWNQAQVTDASHFVVFAVEEPFGVAQVDGLVERTMAARNVSRESLEGYRKLMVSNLVEGPRSKTLRLWASNQAYIALGNLMAAAAALGIDTCPLEGLDPLKFDAILGLPERGLATVCALPLGYRAEDDKYATLPKVRKSLEQLFLQV